MRQSAVMCGFLLLLLCLCASLGLGETRVLLASCHEFVSLPALGYEVSGNLQLLASAFSAAGISGNALGVEDGTLYSLQSLEEVTRRFFSGVSEDDLSIIYLCTHGILNGKTDEYRLILSDGTLEESVPSAAVVTLFSSLPGETLLILDACHSGCVLRDVPADCPSFSLLASASETESAWYYRGDGVESGSLSYFASTLCTGLGLYGLPEADQDADHSVCLNELYQYLLHALPSSTVQLSSVRPEALYLPVSSESSYRRPLTDFSYGAQLVSRTSPVLSFSFTARRQTGILYRLIEYTDSEWNWSSACTLAESAEDTGLSGRISRALSLDTGTFSGEYVILQVFSVEADSVQLCSERLFAFFDSSQPESPGFDLAGTVSEAGRGLTLRIASPRPAVLTIYSRNAGSRETPLLSSFLLRPSVDGTNSVFLPFPGKQSLPAGTTLRVEVRTGSRSYSHLLSLSKKLPEVITEFNEI